MSEPFVYDSNTPRYQTGCGYLYITVCRDDVGNIVRVQCQLGKAGGCLSCTLMAIQELTNLLLAMKCPVEKIKNILRDQQCHVPGIDCLSCVDAIGRTLAAESNRLIINPPPQPGLVEILKDIALAPALIIAEYAKAATPKIDGGATDGR